MHRLDRKFILAVMVMAASLCAGTGIGKAQGLPDTPAAPTFTPATAWTVKSVGGAMQTRMGSMALPCMMMTEFDNGFVMRVAGKGGRILALAID